MEINTYYSILLMEMTMAHADPYTITRIIEDWDKETEEHNDPPA